MPENHLIRVKLLRAMQRVRFMLAVFSIGWVLQFPTYVAAEGYKEEYRAYRGAFEGGNLTSAIPHAQRAWQLAEEEVGDDKTTAILAYNYASHIYAASPEKAIAPLQRVIALVGDSEDVFGVESPLLMLRYVEAVVDEGNKSKRKALQKALERSRDANAPFSLAAARGWYWLATQYIKNDMSYRASKATAESIRNYEAAAPEQKWEYAQALAFGGIAPLVSTQRDAFDIEVSLQRLDKAISLYGPQKSIDDFDPALATTLAWTAVARVTANSYVQRQYTGWKKLKKTIKYSKFSPIRWEQGSPAGLDCKIKWREQEKPRFPRKELYQGKFGGVIIGYRLDRDNKTKDVRILSEVPHSSSFGEESLKYVKKWVAAEALPAGCHESQIVTFHYQIQ